MGHLLPAGEIQTGDGRGPSRVADATALLASSLAESDRLPIDENHATDLAAPEGRPAPARGWIVELQARGDGIWGRVEWTREGKRLVLGRAYRGISPVIRHKPTGEVTAILRASLVNRPNLRGLTALHQEGQDMTLIEKLLAALSLPASTQEDQLVAHVTAMHADPSQTGSQVAIGKAAKLWTMIWLIVTSCAERPKAFDFRSSHSLHLSLTAGARYSAGDLTFNPNFSDWLMGWPIGWTAPRQPVTEWSAWLRHMRGALSRLPMLLDDECSHDDAISG